MTNSMQNLQNGQNQNKPIPDQKYMIQLRSAEPSADAIIKVTSDIEKYWHKEWGNA